MPGNANKVRSWSSVLLPAIVLVTGLGMSLASHSTVGADADYVVEIIVFENEVSSDGGERWRATDEALSLQGAIDPANNNVGISELGPDQSTLTDMLNALNRSGRYRVLTHKIWKQPGYSRDTAKAVRVNSVAGRLDGTVRLERGHYLNLFIDLAYYPRAGFSTVANALRLTQQKRVRKEEVQYFDHPRYGVLAVVRSMDSGR